MAIGSIRLVGGPMRASALYQIPEHCLVFLLLLAYQQNTIQSTIVQIPADELQPMDNKIHMIIAYCGPDENRRGVLLEQ